MAAGSNRGIDAVLAAVGEVSKSGAGWTARCPAHDDGTASLSINVGGDGKALLKCHAGCDLPGIVSALGLTMTDLFPADNHAPRTSSAPAGKRKEVAAYPYHDEHGTLLFEAVRFEPKDFRQRRPGDDGRKVWNLDGVRLVPYRLPELVAAVAGGQTVYIVEGEKDADTLRSWGLAATCNPMGAGKWGKVADVAGDVLRGARVVILPDDDEPGRKHVQDIAARLAGIAASVKVLPHFAGSKDVTSWKESGGTREKLEELAEAAPIWPGPTAAAGQDANTPASGTAAPTSAEIKEAIDTEEIGDTRLYSTKYRWKRLYDMAVKQWYRYTGHYYEEHQSALVDLDDIVKIYKAEIPVAAAAVVSWADKNAADVQYFKSLCKRVMVLNTAKRRENVLKLAAGGIAGAGGDFDRLGICGTEWDRKPYLACASGIIELTREAPFYYRRDGRPEDFIKAVVPTEWQDIDTPAPRWKQFLAEIFEDHPEVIPFMARLIGYALSGNPVERLFVIFWGEGANGKGTFVETLQSVFGKDIAGTVSCELFLTNKAILSSSGPRPDLLALRGMRLAMSSEIKEGRHIDAAELKRLTGGDTLSGRALHSSTIVQFKPTHTLFQQTNYEPGADAKDKAVWDRILKIPFTRRFVKPGDDCEGEGVHTINENLREELLQEAPGIFAWAVRGWLDYAARAAAQRGTGLAPPDVVRQSTKDYRKEQNIEGRFMSECLEDASGEVKAGDVMDGFDKWCSESGVRGSVKRLREMILLTHEKRTTKRGTFYQGLALKEDGNG